MKSLETQHFDRNRKRPPLKVVADEYRLANSSAARFFEFNPFDEHSRARRFELLQQSELRESVRNYLFESNGTLPVTEARSAALAKLSNPRSLFVITGQQVAAFGGPVFTLYKSLTAIMLASTIERELQRPVIALFWLQSEDHDFDEIATFRVLNQRTDICQGRITPSPDRSAQRSLSEESIQEDIVTQLQLLDDALAPLPFSAEELSRLRAAYQPGTSVVAAFRHYLASVFQDEQILFYDPREAGATNEVSELLSLSVRNLDTIDKLLQQQSARLAEEGYAQQVSLRNGSPLFFFHPSGAPGDRFRLQKADSGWTLIGRQNPVDHTSPGQISDRDLQQALTRSTEQFSTSALLRPLMQDMLFPTAAYIAGPAEINYQAQLSPLYSHFGLHQPLIVPRMHALVFEPKAERLQEELQIGVEDLRRGTEHLEKVLAQRSANASITPEALQSMIEEHCSSLRHAVLPSLKAVDPTLIDAFDKFLAKTTSNADAFRARYTKALVRQDQTAEDRLKRLSLLLLPDGQPQERWLSCPHFLARFGRERFLSGIRKAYVPFSSEEVQLRYDYE